MHKILLVDDMRRFLDLEKTFLKRAECRILTTVTGLEAIKVAKTEMPDIILLERARSRAHPEERPADPAHSHHHLHRPGGRRGARPRGRVR